MPKHNNAVLAKVSDLSLSIEKGVNELSSGNKTFDATIKEIHSLLKSLNNSVESIEKSSEKYINILVASNKKFFREFEDTVISKLDRFGSNIQV